MPIIDSKSDSKFDALIRTNKADALMSFIMATSNVSTDDDRKNEVAKRLKSAYELFRENIRNTTSGAGTYGDGSRGILEQFESHYTMGYEMGIWQDSDYHLNPVAMKVAKYNITISEYIGIVFLNLFSYYTKNDQKTYHHFLYEILKKAILKDEINIGITKNTISETLPIEKATEQANIIFNYLVDTDLFVQTDANTMKLSSKWENKSQELLNICNREYEGLSFEKAKEIFKDKAFYAKYVTKASTSNLMYNIDNNNSLNNVIRDNDESYSYNILDDKERKATGENILLYGVPGSGKSWTISEEYCDDESCMERLVFHPDYMYSDFVGQILPIVKKSEGDETEKVRYEFTPGPFTKILKNAYENPSKSFYLIIEEINRGNAPAIFGEIFQLLDRMPTDKIKDNKVIFRECTSEYGITNASIAKDVYGNEDRKIRIPSNLSIIGTMNTSDQNVFTLDTAFQRRWIMRMIPNSFEGHKFGNKSILDTEVSWKQFCEAVNEEILRRNNVTSSEDKRLGAYFITASDLELEEIPENKKQKEQKRIEHKNARFAEKVLKYLWDDAFKFSHAETFDTKKYKSLEDVIKGFMTFKEKARFNVFHENLRKLIIEGVEKADNIVLDTSDDAE